MSEMKNPRPTYLYNRGSYTEPMYTVEPKVPDILPQMNSDLPKSRLGSVSYTHLTLPTKRIV